MDQLREWDKQLLVFLNSYHADWLDPVMILITKTWFWIPFYIFLLYLIIKNYKKEAWIVVVVLALLLTLTDQLTSTIMKPYFARLRPSQDPSLIGVIHIVKDWMTFPITEYRGGKYGFASGHASNTFATAMFGWLLFKNKYRWAYLFFLWAAVMTYTRIYLGVHYPGDILVGGALGTLLGWLAFLFYKWLDEQTKKRKKLPSLGSNP